MEEGKIHILYHKNIRALGWLVMIIVTPFFFVVYYEVFFISVILQRGCNEIESRIVNCIMILVARRVGKRRWEQKNVKIVETDMDIWH